MKKIIFTLLLLAVITTIFSALSRDRIPPAIEWVDAVEEVGSSSRIVLFVEDVGRGLDSLEVSLLVGDRREVLLSERFPASRLPWGTRTTSHEVVIEASESLAGRIGEEGPFQLEVFVRDQPWLWLFSNQTRERRDFSYDLTPPRIDVLSREHYIRQGGSETILYRVSEAGISGVQVGERIFRGFEVDGLGKGVYLCLFALDYDQSPDTSMFLWAQDRAGNRSQVSFWRRAFATRFRQRTLELSDDFMSMVVPEILSNSREVQEKATLLETYLEINGPLREKNNRRISEISMSSSDRILWNEAFIQLSGSQVEANFADRRTYRYQGNVVDQQTHLGFDLASVARSPVEAANDGIVVFADYLGIYGNCVIVDHGFGLQSLYAHLSTIEVNAGDFVTRSQSVGRTGETGLAAGDHLHFSMVLQGVQVNPMEWWDPRWVQQRIFDRISPIGVTESYSAFPSEEAKTSWER